MFPQQTIGAAEIPSGITGTESLQSDLLGGQIPPYRMARGTITGRLRLNGITTETSEPDSGQATPSVRNLAVV